VSDLRERIAKACAGVVECEYDWRDYLEEADAVLEALGWKPGMILVPMEIEVCEQMAGMQYGKSAGTYYYASAACKRALPVLASTSPLEKPE